MSCLTLKKSRCKNCYKCIRHCPVKSIRFTGNQAYIIPEACILCGHCIVACPQNAKECVSQREKVRVLLQSGDPVVASIAPSFIANYNGVGIEAMRDALKKIGFYDVEETAIGATFVKKEYERILADEDRDIVISSCCHSVNLLIQKYFPDTLEYLADIVSPMQAHSLDIKRRIPGARTVFIGPCLAKLDEAESYSGIVDAALMFEELTEWLAEEKIELEKTNIPLAESRARFFPTTGGILKTMTEKRPEYAYMAVDGVENCIAVLKDIQTHKVHHCFIEMSVCAGSCIGGPGIEKYRHSPVQNYLSVVNAAGKEDFDIASPEGIMLKKNFEYLEYSEHKPSEDMIIEIMHKMGKFTPEQELNCGSCGYNSCRDKAVAILQGKADISMCLPFLKDKAESFSDIIVKNSPNALIVLNENLEVQQINAAALKIFNLRSASDIIGDPIIRVLDPSPFIKIQQTGVSSIKQRIYLAEYDCYVVETIVYDRSTRMFICILHNITEEEKERKKRESIGVAAIDAADKVVDKQMRIVQEVASLLGETVAETKIVLSGLKEAVEHE